MNGFVICDSQNEIARLPDVADVTAVNFDIVQILVRQLQHGLQECLTLRQAPHGKKKPFANTPNGRNVLRHDGSVAGIETGRG